MSETARAKRRYDSSGRRRRAEATHERVISSAAQVFLDRGYVGATIPAIAEEAGVALQTVYRSAPGKAGLLAAAVRAAVAGGYQRSLTPVEQRSAIQAVIAEKDPRRQLALYAHTQPGIWSRVGPLWRVLEAAAASEPELRDFKQEQEETRLKGLTRLADSLRERNALRPSVTPSHAADIIVTLGSYATYESLVITRGWTGSDYENWLSDTLQRCLLV